MVIIVILVDSMLTLGLVVGRCGHGALRQRRFSQAGQGVAGVLVLDMRASDVGEVQGDANLVIGRACDLERFGEVLNGRLKSKCPSVQDAEASISVRLL